MVRSCIIMKFLSLLSYVPYIQTLLNTTGYSQVSCALGSGCSIAIRAMPTDLEVMGSSPGVFFFGFPSL